MKQLLETKFTYENYSELLTEILNEVQVKEPFLEEPDLESLKTDIKGFYNLGTFKDTTGRITLLLAIQTVNNVDKERRKQKSFTHRLINGEGCDSAIVAFYTEEEPTWRLSFISSEDNKLDKSAKNTKVNKSKRFSYLLGEGQPIKTVYERLLKLSVKEQITQEDLEESFSVGTLNNDFFNHYKKLHEELVEKLEQSEYFKSGHKSFTPDEFSKKLMGQVVFLYFIQKKGWLGGKLFKDTLTKTEFSNILNNPNISEKDKQLLVQIYIPNTDEFNFNKEIVLNEEALNNLRYSEIDTLNTILNGITIPKGKDNFIRNLFENMKPEQNFLHDYLEPLFYQALNKERGKCEYFEGLGVRVPFLNGGLFDHLPGYTWENKEITLENEFFSNSDDTGMLDIFDDYNFTVYEASEGDTDYGIDPEMLGHIFESLMSDVDKKSKGTVYTPREIVQYMCKETLIHHIDNHTDIPKEDIEKFIYEGTELVNQDTLIRGNKLELSESIYNNIELLDNLLETVKIAEPSVGSGAFLVGMLQEITNIRLNLLEYRILKNPEQEHVLRYGNDGKYTSYNIKLNAIKNSLHAVDIEPSAIHITKLRLWLSLVIEDNGDKGVHRLPNLDFKIVCGDSLVEEFEGVNLDIKNLDNELAEVRKVMTNLSVADKGRKEKKVQESRLKELIEKYKQITILQDNFFDIHDIEKKKEQIQLIQGIEKEIFLTILKIRGKEEVIDKLDVVLNNVSKPFFLWNNYFYNVYLRGGFDIVIGNPPYVRGSRIENKDLIKKRFSDVYQGNADLLIYFYVLGFDLLKDNGILSYITSNKWLRAGYGEKFRQYLIDNVDVLDIIDFGGLKIFEGAGVDVNILTGRKSKELTEWNYTDGSKWE